MIGKLLGHARMETTSRYAHLARDSVRESAEWLAVSIAAITVSTVRPIIFHKLGRDPAVAARHLVTALGDLLHTTLYPGGGDGDTGVGRGRGTVVQPLP